MASKKLLKPFLVLDACIHLRGDFGLLDSVHEL